jgi:hypothetical protein
MRTPEEAAEAEAFQLGRVNGMAWALRYARELKTLAGVRKRLERMLAADRAQLLGEFPHAVCYSDGIENIK